MRAEWDMWLYKGREPRLFTEGEEVPEGWLDAPHDPLDHDGDGTKGGSLPKRRGRPRKAG